ncbi:MAG TPA: lysophospholipase [Thermoguttaceae bacterium]|nr:lysophospholipase [Thermoguttaceae bacterium]
MPHVEDRFEGYDGLALYENRWLPEGDAAAAVVVVHGFLEHSGRHAEVAVELNRHGYAVYAIDLRGHGKSEGDRVFVGSFLEYLRDVELFLAHVRSQQPDRPVFLVGFSLGGTIAATLAARGLADVRGLVLAAPAVQIGRGIFPVLRLLAGFVGRFLPRLRVVRMGFRKMSRDPAVIAQVERDPLVFHGRFPARTGAEILSAVRLIQDMMEAIELPLLILHGTGDLVTDAEGSRQLHARARSTDKTLKLYDGLYHDLFHEPEKEQVLADLVEWLDARR